MKVGVPMLYHIIVEFLFLLWGIFTSSSLVSIWLCSLISLSYLLWAGGYTCAGTSNIIQSHSRLPFACTHILSWQLSSSSSSTHVEKRSMSFEPHHLNWTNCSRFLPARKDSGTVDRPTEFEVFHDTPITLGYPRLGIPNYSGISSLGLAISLGTRTALVALVNDHEGSWLKEGIPVDSLWSVSGFRYRQAFQVFWCTWQSWADQSGTSF